MAFTKDMEKNIEVQRYLTILLLSLPPCPSSTNSLVLHSRSHSTPKFQPDLGFDVDTDFNRYPRALSRCEAITASVAIAVISVVTIVVMICPS